VGAALAGKCARRVGTFSADFAPADGGDAWVRDGLVDEVAAPGAALREADVVVLAMPTQTIADALPAVAGALKAGAVLTDVGSAKRAIVRAMDELDGSDGVACVGGHPMAGRETSGCENAVADLFVGARWAVCRSKRSTDAAVGLVSELVRAAGAEPVEISAWDHDRVVALTSHAPYALGQALAHAIARRVADDEPQAASLAGGGLRDAMRLTRGDDEMWLQILLANRGEVRSALRELEDQVSRLRGLLDLSDSSALARWLADGRARALDITA
jgi:prephenate dehydrogenase